MISLLSKRLSRVFSTPQFKSINFSVLSFLYSPTLTFIITTGKTIWRWSRSINHMSQSLLASNISSEASSALSSFKELKRFRALFWRRQWQPTPVLLPGKSHGQGSLVGCSPWGREESDTTEQLHFHFSLSCIGEGNGNPLQCSCLENPRNRGAWQAAIYGVAQSQTRLKQLSSSSSSSMA